MLCETREGSCVDNPRLSWNAEGLQNFLSSTRQRSQSAYRLQNFSCYIFYMCTLFIVVHSELIPCLLYAMKPTQWTLLYCRSALQYYTQEAMVFYDVQNKPSSSWRRIYGDLQLSWQYPSSKGICNCICMFIWLNFTYNSSSYNYVIRVALMATSCVPFILSTSIQPPHDGRTSAYIQYSVKNGVH